MPANADSKSIPYRRVQQAWDLTFHDTTRKEKTTPRFALGDGIALRGMDPRRTGTTTQTRGVQHSGILGTS